MSGWGPVVLPGGGGSQIPGDTSTPNPSFNLYSEANSVAAGIETDVFTYLVPASPPITHLLRFEFGGTNIGRYRLYFGATVVRQFVTWFNGTGLTGIWEFTTSGGDGLAVSSGTTIKVTVIHDRPQVGDFFAQMTGLTVN